MGGDDKAAVISAIQRLAEENGGLPVGQTRFIAETQIRVQGRAWVQLPEKLEVVHTIDPDDAVGIERYWHERFRDRRRNGEWFVLTKGDVAAFKRRRLFM